LQPESHDENFRQLNMKIASLKTCMNNYDQKQLEE